MKEDGLHSYFSTGWTMPSSNPDRGKKLLSSKRSGLLCGPHSFLYNDRGNFYRVKAVGP